MQPDIDNGTLVNDASATGSFNGTDVAVDDSATVTFAQSPSVQLDKSAALPTGSTGEVGEDVTFTFTVENTGNVTLTAVGITDLLPGLSSLSFDWPAADGVLSPGEVLIATATYTLTQNDLDSGSVTNDATATGEFDGDEYSSDDTVTVPLVQSPALTLDKTVELPSGTTASLGDVLTYSFEVENTGNVTDRVNVRCCSPATTRSVWPALTVLHRARRRRDRVAPVTQDDVDGGFVTNVADANGEFDGDEFTDADAVTVTIVQNPEVTLRSRPTSTRARPESQVHHHVQFVENTGDVTLTDIA